MKHILSAEQFTPEVMDKIFKSADNFRINDQTISKKQATMQLHSGRVMLSMFYEPSTRTRFSFEIAAKKLGIQVIGTENAAEFSSAAKGETIEDTVKVFNEYGIDAIVMRTKEEGHATRAAKVSNPAIINGGDGIGEHPTQALLDIYTIYKEIGRLDNLHVAIGGDLARGRTARSLAQMLAKYKNNEITFVSAPDLKIGKDIKEYLTANKTKYYETDNVQEALSGANVAYWTRLQLERSNISNKKVPVINFALDATALSYLPGDAIIMHPLPRQSELPDSVDEDPRAKYFRQSGNGLYVRMALLDQIMKSQTT